MNRNSSRRIVRAATEYSLMAVEDAPANEETAPGLVTWSGPVVLEGRPTGDGRLIEDNALRWATLPVPFRHAPEDNGGHGGAQVVGHIFTLERKSNGLIWATGDFDMGSEGGREAARQVDEKLTTGVSADLDEVSFELRVASEVIEAMESELDIIFGDDEDAEEPERETDDEGRVIVLKVGKDDEMFVTTDARVRSATMVAIPAFEELRISLDRPLAESLAELDGAEVVREAEALVAGGYPVEPPKAWFLNPDLTEPTHIKITAEGRIYGHLAQWGTCHTAYPGQCVTPPENQSGYAYYRTGTVMTKEGEEIPVGRITMDTLHAGRTMDHAQTMAHYEHTGRAAADVNVGEDAHGIWVAGALRPGITPEQVRALRASPLSGDWRWVAGAMELIGALAVNVPGFPIPRPQGLVAGGRQVSLVASGMIAPEVVKPPGTEGALSTDDLRYLKRIAHRERKAQEKVDGEAQALARRVEALALARKVRNPRPFEFAGWEKQRRIPAGNGRLSGRWADMFNMPVDEGLLADFRGGSAESHLMPHPDVPGQTIFTPERQKFHKSFVRASVKGAKPVEGRQPRYTMMGGGPASGKSNLIESRKGTDRDLEAGRVIVNPDIAKTGEGDIPGIPEYTELAEKGDASAAGYAHEESSYMAKQLMQAAIDDHLDVTNDGTGNSSYGKLAGKVAQARAEGYEVEGQYVTIPAEVALVRAKLRGYRTGRQVSSTMLIDTHSSVSQVVPQALENRLFDNFDLWDNSGPRGSDPIHVATWDVEAGAPVILDTEAYDRFLAKGTASRHEVLTAAVEHAREELEATPGDEFLQRAIEELQAEADAIAPTQEAAA